MTGPADADRRLAPVIRLAPAKVNLTLAVLGSRADGYHDLHSVMVPIGLADRLSLSILPPGMPDALHVDGFDPGPAADNLVLRAIAAARRHAAGIVGRREPLPSLAARLDKRIPVAAGLAGGFVGCGRRGRCGARGVGRATPTPRRATGSPPSSAPTSRSSSRRPCRSSKAAGSASRPSDGCATRQAGTARPSGS